MKGKKFIISKKETKIPCQTTILCPKICSKTSLLSQLSRPNPKFLPKTYIMIKKSFMMIIFSSKTS
jgi:hypothetical protein